MLDLTRLLITSLSEEAVVEEPTVATAELAALAVKRGTDQSQSALVLTVRPSDKVGQVQPQ